MKRQPAIISIIIAIGAALAGCKTSAPAKTDYPISAVSFSKVEINDGFWSPRQEANAAVSIQHAFKKSDETGTPGDDRIIEGAAHTLAKKHDAALEKDVDARIDRLIASLEVKVTDPEKSVLVSGHFFEDAVAYFHATGKRKMLDAAIKFADMMDSAYGPGKKSYISSHERLKIGLVCLYRETGDERYWKLAKFFLDERGKNNYPREGEYAKDRSYAQDEIPVIQRTEATGHCVRATYLYISLTDVAALTGQPAYLQADDKIWEDVVSRKMYLTGGIGSIRFQEKFGAAYELPNLSAWNETCAAYGNAVWNHRLFLLHRDGKYIDTMERVLYNGFLVGVNLKGDRFFYQNPLISYGNYERFDWINVACCPPNVIRLLASLGSYIYAQSGNDLYVNLFIGSQGSVDLGKNKVKIRQETRYPWEGKIKMTVEPERAGRFAVLVRIPGWSRNQPVPSDLYEYMDPTDETPTLKVNGAPVELKIESGYVRLDRSWKPGDTIELDLPMPVHKVVANWQVPEDKGRVALERGPLVYCAEWPDNGGSALNLLITDDTEFKTEFRPNLLDGIQVITGRVSALGRAEDGKSIKTVGHDLVAIPYYAWANRGMGEMAVWIPRRGDGAWVKPIPPEPIARVTSFGGIEKKWTGYGDQNDDLCAVYDGFEPLSSADESYLYYRMRPPAGKPAAIEYEFKTPTEISSSDAYFVDDRRFCRLPESWRILIRDGAGWRPVKNREVYGVEKDKFSRVTFEPVKTTAVRIEVEPKKIAYKSGQIGPPEALILEKDIEWRESGIIEWKVR